MQVREAQVSQYNYILVVGEEEANTGQVKFKHFILASLHIRMGVFMYAHLLYLD